MIEIYLDGWKQQALIKQEIQKFQGEDTTCLWPWDEKKWEEMNYERRWYRKGESTSARLWATPERRCLKVDGVGMNVKSAWFSQKEGQARTSAT